MADKKHSPDKPADPTAAPAHDPALAAGAAPVHDDLTDYPLDATPAQADARKALADDDPAKYDPSVNPLNPKLRRSHKHKLITVEATQVGYYGEKLRRVGDVFVIQSEREYSSKWMKRVAPGTPERLTGSAAELQRQHDDIVTGRLSGTGRPTGDQQVIGDE